MHGHGSSFMVKKLAHDMASHEKWETHDWRPTTGQVRLSSINVTDNRPWLLNRGVRINAIYTNFSRFSNIRLNHQRIV